MFTKIKHKAGETILEWQDANQKQSVLHTLNSHEDPRPEFITALQALTSVVLQVCGLPLNYADDMKILGVSLTEHDTMGLGCVITATKKLSGVNAPLVLNTPHCTETSGNGQNAGGLPDSAVALLEHLVDEAHLYRQGERAQADLFKPAA